MRNLTKLIALLTAALVLTTPISAQGDPGVNLTNYSDGSITLGGITCYWTGVPITDPPPYRVYISSIPLTCANGASGELRDFSISYDDVAGTATIYVDFRLTMYFFWCRYIKQNVVLSRLGSTREYTGAYTTTLHSSNWPSQCANPATIDIWVKLY